MLDGLYVYFGFVLIYFSHEIPRKKGGKVIKKKRKC